VSRQPRLRIGTWNAEWKSPRSASGERIRNLIANGEPDVFVLTEGSRGLLPTGGEVVEGVADWGYPLPGAGSRKVIIWSKNQWTDVDVIGSENLPQGRFVAGTTETPVGPVRVFGVCIPWWAAHVSTGRRDSDRWEEHRRFLAGFGELVKREQSPLVIAGDFNQRIPATTQPQDVVDSLEEVLIGLAVPTAGEIHTEPLIDHIAHSPMFNSSEIQILHRVDAEGQMTDHDGVVMTLTLERKSRHAQRE
jgi:exonuclease III